jgi:hypothetical protein
MGSEPEAVRATFPTIRALLLTLDQAFEFGRLAT